MTLKGCFYILGIFFECVALLCLIFPIGLFLFGVSSQQPLGFFAFQYSPDGFYLLQAVVENFISPAFWVRIFYPLFVMPLWSATSLFAIIFSLLGLPFLLMAKWFGKNREEK